MSLGAPPSTKETSCITLLKHLLTQYYVEWDYYNQKPGMEISLQMLAKIGKFIKFETIKNEKKRVWFHKDLWTKGIVRVLITDQQINEPLALIFHDYHQAQATKDGWVYYCNYMPNLSFEKVFLQLLANRSFNLNQLHAMPPDLVDWAYFIEWESFVDAHGIESYPDFDPPLWECVQRVRERHSRIYRSEEGYETEEVLKNH